MSLAADNFGDSSESWFDPSVMDPAGDLTAIRIKDGIFIGNHAACADRDLLRLNKITHILNCAADEIPNYFEESSAPLYEDEEVFEYLAFPWKEGGAPAPSAHPHPHLPSSTQNHNNGVTILFDSANENLSKAMAFIDDALSKGECVMIHSRLGVSRAPALLAGYFIVKYAWRPSSALNFLRRAHPMVAIQPPFLAQIHALALRFPVQHDIFDPNAVEDTEFGLDNDQWMLRNTLLNCLPHEEQEQNELFQKCIEQVDLGEEVLSEQNSVVEGEAPLAVAAPAMGHKQGSSAATGKGVSTVKSHHGSGLPPPPTLTAAVAQQQISLAPPPEKKPRSERRIFFVDTLKGTKVDTPHSSPLIPGRGPLQQASASTPLFSHYQSNPRTNPMMSAFPGAAGVAALEQAKQMQANEREGGPLLSSEVGQPCPPEPSYVSLSYLPQLVENFTPPPPTTGDSPVGPANLSITSFTSIGSQGSGAGLLRRRCRSPCPHRLLSDPAAEAKGKSELALSSSDSGAAPHPALPHSTRKSAHRPPSPGSSTHIDPATTHPPMWAPSRTTSHSRASSTHSTTNEPSALPASAAEAGGAQATEAADATPSPTADAPVPHPPSDANASAPPETLRLQKGVPTTAAGHLPPHQTAGVGEGKEGQTPPSESTLQSLMPPLAMDQVKDNPAYHVAHHTTTTTASAGSKKRTSKGTSAVAPLSPSRTGNANTSSGPAASPRGAGSNRPYQYSQLLPPAASGGLGGQTVSRKSVSSSSTKRVTGPYAALASSAKARKGSPLPSNNNNNTNINHNNPSGLSSSTGRVKVRSSSARSSASYSGSGTGGGAMAGSSPRTLLFSTPKGVGAASSLRSAPGSRTSSAHSTASASSPSPSLRHPTTGCAASAAPRMSILHRGILPPQRRAPTTGSSGGTGSARSFTSTLSGVRPTTTTPPMLSASTPRRKRSESASSRNSKCGGLSTPPQLPSHPNSPGRVRPMVVHRSAAPSGPGNGGSAVSSVRSTPRKSADKPSSSRSEAVDKPGGSRIGPVISSPGIPQQHVVTGRRGTPRSEAEGHSAAAAQGNSSSHRSVTSTMYMSTTNDVVLSRGARPAIASKRHA